MAMAERAPEERLDALRDRLDMRFCSASCRAMANKEA
jgi:hypothetical protein